MPEKIRTFGLLPGHRRPAAPPPPPMLFLDMILAVVVAISFIPILTGYCALAHGRSFWLWFALGWLLPLVSFFLLLALVARDELNPGRRLVDEARQILREAEKREVQQ